MQLNERTEQALDHSNRVRDETRPTPGDERSLLEMPEPEAAKRILKDWDESWKDIQNIAEVWKVNRARSKGYTGVSLLKKQDKNEAYIPLGAKKDVAGLNKAARLKRRLRATLFADPPMAEATPSRDEDQARDEAEVSTRILQDLCSEGNLAYNLHAGDAFDLGGDYGSGFIRFWVDETGGGWRPKQIEVQQNNATVLQYVDDADQPVQLVVSAAKVWLPKIKDEVLTGKQVRFLPFGVRDLWEADGLMVGTAVKLGQLKSQFPDIQKFDEKRIAGMVQARPQHFKDILPSGAKDSNSSGVSNDSWVFVCSRYQVQSPLYPEGAYIVAAGGEEILHRQTWFDNEHGEPMDIPVTQFKQLTEEDNPYGQGTMEMLGPGNELRSAMLGSELEHLDRFANRRTFVPMTSTLQPHQLQSPTGTPIPILPGGEPHYEEIPDFPVVVEKMLAFVSQDMDDESGLQQSGQGMNPPGVKSGLHAQVILEQVNQALSDLKQNTERGLIRGWRIMLQLVRAYFSVPQQVRWFGDDGRYKQKEWTGADLGSTRDVRIQKGSFTQLSPTAKADLANAYVQAGLLTPQDLQHVIEGNIGGLFGLQDNPHRQRVRRQIAEWNEGPPEQTDAMQPPMEGMAPANPYEQVLAQMFAPVPADDEPGVAMMRTYELGRAMASTKYQRWDPMWQSGLANAYAMARQAAQILDAKQIEEMQKKLAETEDKLKKAESTPKISISTPAAPLDQAQTQAVLAQVGLPVPPAPDLPVEDPNQKYAVERDKLKVESEQKDKDRDYDFKKHKLTLESDVDKERVRQVAKAGEASTGRKHTADLMGQVAKLVKDAKPDVGAKEIIEPVMKALDALPKPPTPEQVAKVVRNQIAKEESEKKPEKRKLAIRRGKDGKIEGASDGKRKLRVVRDKKGKAVGVEDE